jgi:hypothetical protein
MKPKKNLIYCKDSGKTKMLFETEKKALTFMKFNNEEIVADSGYCPQRSYYCIFCGGWHLTSLKEYNGISKKEQFVEKYIQDKEKKKTLLALKQKKPSPIKQEERTPTNNNNYFEETWENQIRGMDNKQKEMFFLENINMNNAVKLSHLGRSKVSHFAGL